MKHFRTIKRRMLLFRVLFVCMVLGLQVMLFPVSVHATELPMVQVGRPVAEKQESVPWDTTDGEETTTNADASQSADANTAPEVSGNLRDDVQKNPVNGDTAPRADGGQEQTSITELQGTEAGELHILVDETAEENPAKNRTAEENAKSENGQETAPPPVELGKTDITAASQEFTQETGTSVDTGEFVKEADAAIVAEGLTKGAEMLSESAEESESIIPQTTGQIAKVPLTKAGKTTGSTPVAAGIIIAVLILAVTAVAGLGFAYQLRKTKKENRKQ